MSVLTEGYFHQLQHAVARLPFAEIDRAVDLILAAHRRRKTIYLLGNGGSAATASHIACDLAKATAVPDQRRLRTVSLVDNTALVTAWANDTSYERIFAEQLENLLTPGDVVVAISARGRSPNVLAALQIARAYGASTVGLTGFDGGELPALTDICITVASDTYGVIEDAHLAIGHAVTAAVHTALQRGQGVGQLASPSVRPVLANVR